MLAGAGGAGGEQIVAVATDGDAEADGVDRPVLADQLFQQGKLGRGLELELSGITPAKQRLCGQRFTFWHGPSRRAVIEQIGTGLKVVPRRQPARAPLKVPSL